MGVGVAVDRREVEWNYRVVGLEVCFLRYFDIGVGLGYRLVCIGTSRFFKWVGLRFLLEGFFIIVGY